MIVSRRLIGWRACSRAWIFIHTGFFALIGRTRPGFSKTLMALILFARASSAAAMEVQCIEESKYKYLYEIFGGDARKFATYLALDTGTQRFPEAELCRAALISGGVGEPNEYEKILDFIIRNKGWLAAIYLSSGGGNVWSGERLGYLVRTFRLKTYTAINLGNKVLYEPDFGLPPSNPAHRTVGAKVESQAPRCLLKNQVPVVRNAKDFVSGLVRPEAFKPTYDENIDREGPSHRDFTLSSADPSACQKACLGDGRCRAWTYRQPEARSDRRPFCSLKDRVLALKNDGTAVSGLARPDAIDATYEERSLREGPAYREFNLSAPDPKLCQKACIDEARCRSWVYRKPEGRTDHRPHCWLKDDVPPRTNADNLLLSGMVARLEYMEPTYEENSTREGQAYREFNVSAADPKLCQKACIDEVRCRAWRYRKPEGRTDRRPHCWLTDHVPPRTNADNLMLSGMVYRPGAFEPTYEKDSDRPAQDYRTIVLPFADPRMCQKSCSDEPKCRAWTYVPPDPSYRVSLMAGWDGYRDRQRATSSAPAPSNNWCTSACTFLHVAGVDRSGVLHVHRANQGWTDMSGQAENLLGLERQITAFYRHMDAGQGVIRLFRGTSATTVTATRTSRFPRYYADYLIANCQWSDPERLQNLETQLEVVTKELAPADSDLVLKIDHLRAALGSLHDNRRTMEQCVARAHERDRLAAFDRICGKGCDQKKLAGEFDAALRKILDSR